MNESVPPVAGSLAGAPQLRSAGRALLVALGLALANTALWFGWITSSRGKEMWLIPFTLLAVAQLGVSIYAIVQAVRGRKRAGQGGVGYTVLGVLGALGAIAGWMLGGLLGLLAGGGGGMGLGGAWGRPLRVRGRQLHPELRLGSDWTRGARPDPRGLDAPTRAALEALWLHDAQKEHASVPAFARITWMLAAVGAPPELLRGAQQAAIEEIDHAERCFALAAGYGGRSHAVEPMPELVVQGTGAVADPLDLLVYESVLDGGQLEDFNADVAARCAAVCREPVTRAVLEQIAREERSHAEFSWSVVEWVLSRDPARARAAIARASEALATYPRPTAADVEKARLVALAVPVALRAHGRLPDAEWAAAWEERLGQTRFRLERLLAAREAA